MSGDAAWARTRALGALLMLAAALAVALDTLIVRVVVQELHPTVILFFRSLFSLVIMAPWWLRAPASAFGSGKLQLHILRALLKLAALGCFFFAISALPLAEVTAIAFASPLFAALGAVLWLGERAGRWRAGWTLAGFAGVLLIVRPGAGVLDLASLAAIAAAIGLAGVALLVKYLSRFDPPNTIVALNLALTAPLALLLAVPFWTTPSPAVLGWLVVQGGLSTIAQVSFTRAMRRADASLLLPIEFSRLPMVAALAYFAFGEVPELWTWIGALVIGSAIFALLWAGGPRQLETTPTRQ